MAKAKHPVPDGWRTVTPQLIMENAASAIEWYTKALGAIEVRRTAGPDGKIIHAEISIGDSRLIVNDDMLGGDTVKAHGGSSIALWVYVPDCDALFNRAVKAGAQVADGPMGKMQDQFWGDRSGMIIDPEGYRWNIATHKEDLTPEELKTRMDKAMRQYA